MSAPFLNVGGEIAIRPSAYGGNVLEGSGAGIGYDAVQSKGRRRVPLARVLSEDLELRQLPRRQLTTNLRDLNRNFAVAAWLIRQHLNYVSTFSFHAHTGDRKLDQEIEDWVEWYGKPENCDPGRRHSLDDLCRMWESLRVVDGDCLINRLYVADDPVRGKYARTNGMIQTIEGDRIQSFGGIPFTELGIDPNWVINGVYVDQAFAAISFMVFRRPPLNTGLVWDAAVSAQFADLFAYFSRYDQVRGISPLASAANSLRDVYENVDYALIKAKVSQIFGVKVTRNNSDEMGELQEYVQPPPANTSANGMPLPPGSAAAAAAGAEEEDRGPKYKINFDKGPLLLDMDQGDDANVIESQTPSTQFQAFNQAVIQIAIKAADLPYCFYDEAHANYAATRIARLNYEDAVRNKRRQHCYMRDRNIDWRIRLAVIDGTLDIPEKILNDKMGRPRRFFNHTHIGLPWYDSQKEVSASIGACNSGMDNLERVCAEHGTDIYRNIDIKARVEAYAREKGTVLSTALPGKVPDDPANPDNEQEEQEDKELQTPQKQTPAKPDKTPKPRKSKSKALARL